MPLQQAETRLQSLDGCERYNSFFDYVADMAAFTTVYKKEVNVKYLLKQKKQLRGALWTATSPVRLGYYFNNINRLSMLPPMQRDQLASGSASNESLNKEINGRYRNCPRAYQATLQIFCDAFHFLKLFTHNTAEYFPTDYQVSQQQYANHYISSFAFSQAEWLTVLKSPTPLFSQRCEQETRIRQAKKKSASIAKKVKRHTFNKKLTLGCECRCRHSKDQSNCDNFSCCVWA